MEEVTIRHGKSIVEEESEIPVTIHDIISRCKGHTDTMD